MKKYIFQKMKINEALEVIYKKDLLDSSNSKYLYDGKYFG